MKKNSLNLEQFRDVNPLELETTKQKFLYMVSRGIFDLPDNYSDTYEFDEQTEFYINYVFETWLECVNQGEEMPPFTGDIINE